MTLASAGAGVDAAGVHAAFLVAAVVSLVTVVVAVVASRLPAPASDPQDARV